MCAIPPSAYSILGHLKKSSYQHFIFFICFPLQQNEEKKQIGYIYISFIFHVQIKEKLIKSGREGAGGWLSN